MIDSGTLTLTQESCQLYGQTGLGSVAGVVGWLDHNEWVLVLCRWNGFDYYDCLTRKGRFYIYCPRLVLV